MPPSPRNRYRDSRWTLPKATSHAVFPEIFNVGFKTPDALFARGSANEPMAVDPGTEGEATSRAKNVNVDVALGDGSTLLAPEGDEQQ